MQTLSTHDGLPLHLRSWAAPGLRPPRSRGVVILVHGLGEHIGRYEVLAADLNRAGWDVAGYDQRGHGASAGPRGGLNASDDLLRDLSLVIDTLRPPDGRPLVLLGHSMGGLLVARFLAETLGAAAGATPQDWSREVDAAVLSSPALDAGMNGAQKMLLAALGPLAPGLAVNNGLKPDWISRDPSVVKAYMADPLVHDRITPRLVRFIVDGGALAIGRAAQWRVPTLLMWAGADRCVSPAGSEAFAAAAPPSVVQPRSFDKLFHEIFNEPERDEVVAALLVWLERRFPR